MKVSDLPDDILLSRLLDAMTESSKFEAFNDMHLKVLDGQRLSGKQREWAEDEFLKRNLDCELPAENLISSGQYTPTAEERAKKYPFEMMPKPLRPPGR